MRLCSGAWLFYGFFWMDLAVKAREIRKQQFVNKLLREESVIDRYQPAGLQFRGVVTSSAPQPVILTTDYDPEAECSKCGHDDIGTYHMLKDHVHAGNIHCGLKTGEEHMDRYCKRCKYAWPEAPIKVKKSHE